MPPSRILIADDNVWVARSLERLIVSLPDLDDAEVITVADGQAALDACARGSFDWVIADLTMPIKNGLDVLEALERDGFGGKRILMTGQYEPWIQSRAEALGAHATLFKPLDPDALAALLSPTVLPPDDPDETLWPPDLLGDT